MRKKVLQTVLVSGLIAAQVVLQFPTVVYAESGEEVQTEVVSTSGATEGTSGTTEGTSGADEGTSVSNEGTSGADEGTSGSTGVSAEGSESNEAAGGTTTEGSESESSDSNEANTGESSESSEGTSGSVGENSEDTSDTSETGSTESAELTYKVTFKDSLDETFEVVVEVEENASAEAPEVPEHEGYVFVEWDADFSSVTEDMTVTAQYEEFVATPVLRSPLRSPAGGTSPAFSKTYEILTVEAAAGVIPDDASVNITKNTVSDEMEHILRTWFYKQEGDKIIRSVSYYTVSFKDVNNEDFVPSTIKFTASLSGSALYKSALGIISEDATAPFYKYIFRSSNWGVSSSSASTSIVQGGAASYNIALIEYTDYDTEVAGDYNITFDDMYDGSYSFTRKYQADSIYYTPSDIDRIYNATRPGYTFIGWSKDRDNYVPLPYSDYWRVTSDMTVYGFWRQNTCNVTYNLPYFLKDNFIFNVPVTVDLYNKIVSVNNGDFAPRPINISGADERGVYVDIAPYMIYDSASRSWTVKDIPDMSCFNYNFPAYMLKFYGWYKDAAFTIPYDFTEPVTGDITLYAKAQKTPLVFGTVIDLYFDYGYKETMNKINETRGRWSPDTSINSSHLTKKSVYYSKWLEADVDLYNGLTLPLSPPYPTLTYIPSPFSSEAAISTEGVDSGYKMYMSNRHSEIAAPEGYMRPSQMYNGAGSVLFRYFLKDDSSPVPPVTPVQPSNPTPTPSDDPTPNPSEDPTPSVSPTPSVEPTETPSPTVSPSVSPAPSATPSPTVKPSAKPTQKPDSEDDEEDESGVLSSTHEVMDLVAEEVKEGSLTYVESNQFGFSRAYTLRSLNLDGKVKRVVNTKEV